MADTNVSSTPVVPSDTGALSITEAATHISGLLDLGDGELPENPEEEIEESDDADEADSDSEADEDSPIAADEDDEEIETPVEESIDPPKSWKATDQEAFKKLPRELQQVVQQREAERDRAIGQRLEQIAGERKVFESERAKAEQAQNQYAQNLDQLLALTIPEIRQFEGIDWYRLSQEDQGEYVRLKGMHDQVVNRVNTIQGEMQRVHQYRAQQIDQGRAQFLQDQHSRMLESIPELADPEKGKVLLHDITTTMNNYGFNEQELGAVMDHRVVRVMARLAQLEKAEATRATAQAKKSATAPTRFQKPNAAQPRDNAANGKVSKQYDRLKRTGDLRDAAAFFENFL